LRPNTTIHYLNIFIDVSTKSNKNLLLSQQYKSDLDTANVFFDSLVIFVIKIFCRLTNVVFSEYILGSEH
jgi:hypothetical protein